MTTRNKPKAKQITLSVPLEVAARLKAIAATRQHDSIAELLVSFVNEEMDAGRIPKDIPGIRVTIDGDRQVIDINSAVFSMAVQRDLAGLMSQSLRKAMTGGAYQVGTARVSKSGPAGVKVVAGDGRVLAMNLATTKELAGLIEDVAAQPAA